MKKMYLLAVLMAAAMPFTSMAQDDDLYFNPKKEAKEKAERKAALLREYKAQQARRDSIYALFWSGSNRNVDEYNRRQATPDTSYVPDAGYDEEGVYTSRLIRFHSPRVGVVVSSPYYGLWVDCYDPWLTPWDADFYCSSWYGWGLSPYYYHSSFYWRYGWYDPWWSYSWGWHPGWYPGWYDHWHWGGWAPKPGGGRYLDTSRRVTAYRPSRGYNSSDGRYSSSSYRPSRDNYRPSRENYRPSAGSQRVPNSGVTRPSRSYGNSGSTNTRTETRPSRSYGNSVPSRSSVSSPSMPSRSYGNSGGGGRSFGNSGGGRSFGGRR